MGLRYHSLLRETIYFLYHSRKLVVYICKYLYYKFSYNSKYLITYNHQNNKIVKKNINNYKLTDSLSIVRTKIDNVVLYNRILFPNGIKTDFNKVLRSKHDILSVAIKVGEKEYDFNILPFSVINNKILDKMFVYWYLKYKYNVICNDDYSVSVIDNNINIHTITKNQYIILTDNSFIIKTI